MSTFEQFVKFTTESVGLERTFRLLQSIVQILSSFTLPFDLLITLLSLTTQAPPSPAVTHAVLLSLRQRLALGRRYFRVFKFLESFDGAQKTYASINNNENGKKTQPQTDAWLDVLGKTFNGMYLLLEAATLIDALQIPGLSPLGPQTERRLTVEAQRFWLFSLVCGVVSGLLKILYVLAYTPVPAAYSAQQQQQQQQPDVLTAPSVDQEKKKQEGDDDDDVDDNDEKGRKDLRAEQQRLRGIVKSRKAGQTAWRREVRGEVYKLGRGVVANALDITLPGTVVGWVKVQPGTVGVAMLVTTVLTGMDAWERCGREVGRK
ncbi:peroxisomal biogenesis factor 11 [Xylariomycetidae sp. FL2044]|nr:peroxisomal biogenesis factor 11 [Xylariomycetidae sp. FL2044]